jgi:hypothetical protein
MRATGAHRSRQHPRDLAARHSPSPVARHRSRWVCRGHSTPRQWPVATLCRPPVAPRRWPQGRPPASRRATRPRGVRVPSLRLIAMSATAQEPSVVPVSAAARIVAARCGSFSARFAYDAGRFVKEPGPPLRFVNPDFQQGSRSRRRDAGRRDRASHAWKRSVADCPGAAPPAYRAASHTRRRCRGCAAGG